MSIIETSGVVVLKRSELDAIIDATARKAVGEARVQLLGRAMEDVRTHPNREHLNRLCQIMSAHGMSTGHGDDMGQVMDELEWQLKERNAQAPVARVTGYYGGRCVIEPLDGKSVFPVGMAVYTRRRNETD